MKKMHFQFASSILALAIALAGAFSALAEARIVDVIAVFGGAFGAGASLTAAIRSRRDAQVAKPL